MLLLEALSPFRKHFAKAIIRPRRIKTVVASELIVISMALTCVAQSYSVALHQTTTNDSPHCKVRSVHFFSLPSRLKCIPFKQYQSKSISCRHSPSCRVDTNSQAQATCSASTANLLRLLRSSLRTSESADIGGISCLADNILELFPSVPDSRRRALVRQGSISAGGELRHG